MKISIAIVVRSGKVRERDGERIEGIWYVMYVYSDILMYI